MKKLFTLSFILLSTYSIIIAQDIRNNPSSNHGNKFEQLGTILPTPNEYRTASGAPGPKYWQQRADYDIKATSALEELYKEKIKVDHLQKLLSVGLLGVKMNRRMVPTRWSITATDDIISKKLLEKIRYFPEVQEKVCNSLKLRNKVFL